MNIQKAIKKNPKTSIVTVIAIVTTAWNMFGENAELFGVPAKTIAIGSAILAIVAMAVNQFSNNSEG